MRKNAFTLIIVPDASSQLHKLRLRIPGLYVLAAGTFVLALIVSALGMHYTRMALKTADYDTIQSEIETLRVENKNLEVAARQLNTKIRELEDRSERIEEIMLSDTWNQRLGLVASGIGGSVEDYPTASIIQGLNVRDNIQLARGHTADLDDQLHLVEQLVEHRADKLLLTPSIWPVSGPIRSSYGRRRDPFTGESENHLGLDIGALYGTAVSAPANGRVRYAQRRSAYGNLIVIDHGGGITTRYGHLSEFAVQIGDQIQKGDVIGYVGSTGRSTGPHLHYEVRLNDRPTNPRNYLPPPNTSSIAD